MNGISEVGIDYAGEGRGNRIAAALLVGWLASALGWKLAAGGRRRQAAWWWRISRPRAGGRSQVAFRSVPKAHLAQGEVSALRIAGRRRARRSS